ncbi:MAG TPA: phosphate ABC transporter ATP-binding protein PstB [Anaerolineaceae bacterium]|nr:phosphate ABC transporter ATP-binding protein [Longilinea sp.]HNZ00444.1 phosphate ABC transporter ATP-binding protein PstB [Anaerolineaceae bacterium]HOD45086.1 phosphate ABC transporter ATP-binding protein PstB [Anaerolineaceae bacterium]HOH19745.1 phosphate ABC transporter ATP-binding protein PstB [Anaerolineaceae bacterium]HOU43936.1 phosphate ABC transporter ATP-binding protein PstB [Anaerolineaceae bacterium]
MDKIVIENLSVRYSDGTESLKNINLKIPEQSITALIGPAGGGKSTLLRVLNRLNDLADVVEMSGRVLLNGRNIYDPDANVIELRRKMGIVFSRPVPLPLTIYQNVSYGLEVAGIRSKSRLDDAVEKALRLAALWDEVHDRLNDPAIAISGGQQQRLCLARALALEPEVILLDEPTSALDPVSTARIENLLQDLKEQYTIIIVPHSIQQAARVADWVAFFLQGELVEYAARDRMFLSPKDRRTQEYIEGRYG